MKKETRLRGRVRGGYKRALDKLYFSANPTPDKVKATLPSFSEVGAAAAGRWLAIHRALGIDPDALSGKHCACPGCGGRDRFRTLKDYSDRGSWICGQGGAPTGGDGFDLLVHVHHWSKAEALVAVANHLGISTGRGRRIQAHRRHATIAEQQALAVELLVLWQIVSTRNADRENARNRAFKDTNPEFRPMPEEHWEREVLAVKRVTKLVGVIYGR